MPHSYVSNPGPKKIIVKVARQYHFTLLELLIVLVIVSAGLALIGPRIGKLPSRLVIRNAVASLETAFSEAGMRARATGQPVTLILQPEQNQITLRDRAIDEGEFKGEVAARQKLLTSPSVKDHENSNLNYDVDERIKWRDGVSDRGHSFREEKNLSFIFFPDGNASGPDLDFVVRGRSFRLKVARLTGRIRVFELNK